MAKVEVLPETVQNQIAAGEVIERPSSAVKELVENALDAGARLVTVELEEGGHRLIRVVDDGSGMDEADLTAALQRHATSKIREASDIFRVATFGFRGEALPSIASVSRLRIVTCPEDGEEGRELAAEAGRIVRLSPAPAVRGTRVEVRDLFFNTPARRRFLRQPASENSRTGEALARLALGNPGVAFRLQVNGRLTLAVLAAASQRERLAGIFGDEAAGRLVPFAREVSAGLSVHGFFARPPRSCRNSRDIRILVNRRWIRSPALARAAADAFQGALPPREYPFALINLEVDPERVDVNVHPAKEEVRFEQEGLVIGGVKAALREALDKLAGPASPPGRPAGGLGPAPDGPVGENGAAGEPPAAPFAPGRDFRSGPSASGRDAPRPEYGFPPGGPGVTAGFSPTRPAAFAAPNLAAARELLRSAPSAAAGGGPLAAESAPDAGSPAPAPAVSAPALELASSGRRRVLGQVGGRYILLDDPEGLLLIDPHALHERWNYDRLAAESRRGAASVRLLLPLEMRLSPAEAAVAPEAAPLLAEYGFEADCPGPDCLRVSAGPSFVPPDRLENLLRQILADLGEAGDVVKAARDRLLASLACRSSVLLGRHLAEEEMLALLERFFSQGQLPVCPHGRPTAVRVGWDELARRFGR